jgi:hypothetical protein
LDGCGDHRAMFADEDLHRHAIDLKLVSRMEHGTGAVAMRDAPAR